MLHCVVDTAANPTIFVCKRCGGTAPLPLPLSIKQMKALTDQFLEQHRNCALKKAG